MSNNNDQAESGCMADPSSVSAAVDDLHNTVSDLKTLLEYLLLEMKRQTAVMELTSSRSRRSSGAGR